MAKSSRIHARWAMAVPVMAMGAGAFAAGAAAPAASERPWRVSIGVNNFSSGDTRDAVGATGLKLGVGYTLGAFTQGVAGFPGGIPYGVELDWARNRRDGRELDALSLSGVVRVPLGQSTSYGSFYYGLGLGLTFFTARTPSVGSGNNGGNYGGGGGGNYNTALGRVFETAFGTSSSTDRYTRLFGKLILGYEFTQGYFVEATYKLAGSVDGFGVNSLGLSIGYKF